MAKSFDSVKSFIGKEVIIEYIQSGSEEITGTVTSVKDGVISLVQEFRGSTYKYRIPATEVVFVKGENGEIAKGATVTLERSIAKRIKVKGTLIGVDALGLIVSRGVIRGRETTTVISSSTFETLSYGELTAEGAKAREKQSKRLKASKSEKSSKKTKGDKKAKKAKK